MEFLTAISFLSAFSKILNKRTESESEPKHKEKLFSGVFLQKPKTHKFWGSKIVVFKTQILNYSAAYCKLFNVKGSFMPTFTKNINIWAPWNFWKCKLWRMCPSAHRKIGFGLLKSYLTFGYLTCFDRSKNCPHPTLLYSTTVLLV